MEIKGIVLEKDDRRCVLLTPDGQFRRVTLPPNRVIELGHEVAISTQPKRLWQTILVAASLLLVAVAWQLWGGMVPRAVAYVSLDLNPSIELGLDRRNIIVSATGLNKQGGDLLATCPVISKTMEEGINEIISATVVAGYLSRERNIVVSTVTVTGSGGNISEELVTRVIEGSLASSSIQAEVLVQDVGVEIREEARQQGLSPGRYLAQQKEGLQDVTVTVEQLGVADKNPELKQEKEVRPKKEREDKSSVDNSGKPPLEPPGRMVDPKPPGLAGNDPPGLAVKEDKKEKIQNLKDKLQIPWIFKKEHEDPENNKKNNSPRNKSAGQEREIDDDDDDRPKHKRE